MGKEPTTQGLSCKKIIELLNIGAVVYTPSDDIDQQKADLLSDRLREILPVYYLTEKKPFGKLSPLRKTIAVLAGESVGELLQDPKTDIAIIRITKHHGRKLSTCAKSEAEYQAANTVYYAAIAHSLVFHGLKITKHSYGNLHEYFGQLSEENWIPEGLLGLFTKASEYCKARMK